MRKGKFEDEKKRLESVRAFLNEASEMAKKEQDVAARTERFRDAEIYKSFKDFLKRAIELCGEEKPKEDKKMKEISLTQNKECLI